MNLTSLKRRLVESVGANFYGQFVSVAVQLLQVPLLLHYWGTELFGEWLVLYAIPGYLILMDLGVATVASNRLCTMVAAGQHVEARAVLRTTWLFMIGMMTVLGILLPIGAFLFDWAAILKFRVIAGWDTKLTLCLLGLMVVFSLPSSLQLGLYRAGLHNARGVVVLNTFRLLQIGAMGAAAGSTAVWRVAAALLGLQILATVAVLVDVRRFIPKLGVFGKGIDWTDLLGMWRPSLAYMLFPFANAIYFQGATLVVNAHFGAAAVVLFNTSRTLTRVVSQSVASIKHAIWPEFSHLFGSGKIDQIRRLYYLGIEISVVLSVLGSGALLLAAEPLLRLWTHGQVTCDYPLLFWLSAATIINALWFSASALLNATNKHSTYALVYCASCIAAISLAASAGSLTGIVGVAIAMLLVELVTGVVVFAQAGRIVGDTIGDSIRAVISFREIFMLLRGFRPVSG